MSRIYPLTDRVLIEPEEAASSSPGGILIPDLAKRPTRRGKVLATGPGDEGALIPLNKNDVVLFEPFSGHEVEHDGKKYRLLKFSEILARVA